LRKKKKALFEGKKILLFDSLHISMKIFISCYFNCCFSDFPLKNNFSQSFFSLILFNIEKNIYNKRKLIVSQYKKSFFKHRMKAFTSHKKIIQRNF